MRNLEFTSYSSKKSTHIVQVSKPTALKLFLAGERIFIQTSNYHPFGAWSQALEINFDKSCGVTKESYFADITGSFEYHNCSYKAGYYVIFYKVVQ